MHSLKYFTVVTIKNFLLRLKVLELVYPKTLIFDSFFNLEV